jgi:hypothetical protein
LKNGIDLGGGGEARRGRRIFLPPEQRNGNQKYADYLETSSETLETQNPSGR